MKDRIQENSPELKKLHFRYENYIVSNQIDAIQKSQFTVKLHTQHWDKEDISKLLNRKKRSHTYRLGIRKALNF